MRDPTLPRPMTDDADQEHNLWQSTTMTSSAGSSRNRNRPGRVVASHRMLAIALAIAAAFAVVAIVWAIVIAMQGGTWWGPIHAFLAGTALAAISGATQMFTITWSTTSPPASWMTITQGSLLVGGVALVLVGVPAHADLAIWLGGLAVIGSLALLATSLTTIIRKSLLRRFDQSSRFYLLALGSGVVGVTLGILLGSGAITSGYGDIRLVHLHLNLIGLVGFTIIGTLPTILVTFAKHKIVSGREVRIAWKLCLASSVLVASAIVGPIWLIGVGALLAAVAALVVTAGVAFRLGGKQMKGGLPYWAVITGVLWLVLWTGIDAANILSRSQLPYFSRWTAIAVVFGVGQVIVGSVAYLVPVVFGAPIGDNLTRMTSHPILPLITANLAALALALNWPAVAIALASVWGIDFVRRLAMLRKPDQARRTTVPGT